MKTKLTKEERRIAEVYSNPEILNSLKSALEDLKYGRYTILTK